MALQAIFFTQSQLLIDPLSRIPCSLRSNPFQALTSHAYARAAHQTIVCTSETWNPTITASSASTKPRTWDYGIVPSLSNTEYTEKEWAEEVQKMGDDVRVIMNKKMEPLEKLELIDAIQRLGLEYHFKMEIEHSLKSLYESAAAAQHEYDDLYSAALRFRIFRQHHYYEIPQDVFRKFIDSETGNFRWWTELGLGNMTFFRDNLVEHCLWTSLVIFDPKYSDLREMTTKVVAMITLIDDVYDLLGTLEELELLTHLINQLVVHLTIPQTFQL
ncbi:hypothetical protein CRG98_046138 [Punica granatum]|uniref:Terpene synthase N-terminal domain-containing protein n=1 Tax=Punica granatum TaxID=22663 RepID=A0A2I0HP53_PUNGR|nr:hypothetical protein CRG98_046138 [Punica granatum]